MSKVLERLVCRQLVAYFKQHGLLPSLQSPYRKHHSTEIAILKVVSDVLLAADRGDVALLGLLDLLAAFDTVDHENIINRLQMAFGIRGKELSWILSFTSQWTQTVSFNVTQLIKSAVVCRVLQSSVLWSVLFLLYTADVIGIARRHGITRHSYADDTELSIHTLAASCGAQIPRNTACIEELERWMSSNRLKLNVSKRSSCCWATDSKSQRLRCNFRPWPSVASRLSSLAVHIRRFAEKCFYHIL